MVVEEISEIVSDLMKVGAKIPDYHTKCNDNLQDLIHEYNEAATLAHAFTWTPSPELKNWDTARVTEMRKTTVELNKKGFLADEQTKSMMLELDEAQRALNEDRWLDAAGRLQYFRTDVEQFLLEIVSNCASAKKGDIISGVYYGINVHKEVDPTHKNIIWQDQIAALNRHGILTSEEADKLLKVRW